MESITVRIQGESDWLQPVLIVQELNKLMEPSIDLSHISARIGQLLDCGTLPLTNDQKNEVLMLLSKYVANLKVYQHMIEEEMNSLIITSFRAGNPFDGYITRVAGAIRDHIENSIVVVMNDSTFPIEDVGYIILLQLISFNPKYKTDPYNSKSNYWVIADQAKLLSGKIEISCPQNSKYN